MASVLRLCHEGGVMTYDEQAVSAARREAESGRDRAASASGDTLTYRTDPAVSILRIRLDLYDAPGLPSPIADLRKEIRCADRQHEAAAVP